MLLSMLAAAVSAPARLFRGPFAQQQHSSPDSSSRTKFPQPQVAKKYSPMCRWLHGPSRVFPHTLPPSTTDLEAIVSDSSFFTRRAAIYACMHKSDPDITCGWRMTT